MKWAGGIKEEINRYQNQIIPMIRKEDYGEAGIEIGKSISRLQKGYKDMPFSRIKTPTWNLSWILISRFEVLKIQCLIGGLGKFERKQGVEKAMELIEEKISPLERGIDSILENSRCMTKS